LSGPLIWVHPVERYARTRGSFKQGIVALGLFSRACQIRCFAVVRTKIECRLVDNAFPEVGGRIQMEIDEKKDTVEVAAPSDTIADQDLADAMHSIDSWIVQKLGNKQRNRFDMVRRVAEAAQALIRAAEPTALDFAGDGQAQYDVAGIRQAGFIRGLGGAPGDQADLLRQMMGMLQPNLATRNAEAQAAEQRQRAAELADLLVVLKDAPEGPDGDEIRTATRRRISVLTAVIGHDDIVGEKFVEPEEKPAKLIGILPPDPQHPDEKDEKKLTIGSKWRWKVGAFVAGPAMEGLIAEVTAEGAGQVNYTTTQSGGNPLDCTDTVVRFLSRWEPVPPATIERGSRWRPQSGAAFHVKVAAVGPNDAGQQLVSFTVHPDDGSTDVSMLKDRGILSERDFREHYRFSNDPMPAQPVMSASLRSDLLAQAQARKFTEAASGIDMHIMPREVFPEGTPIVPGSHWRHVKLPGNLATVLRTLPITGSVQFLWDTGMGEHTDSYARIEFLRNWEPMPEKKPPMCLADNPLHPGANCALPKGHTDVHQNGTCRWPEPYSPINRGSVWVSKEFSSHTVVVEDQRGDHTVLFHPSASASDDHRSLPEQEFRSAYTPTSPVFGQEHNS
jgi:hypothetical protein